MSACWDGDEGLLLVPIPNFFGIETNSMDSVGRENNVLVSSISNGASLPDLGLSFLCVSSGVDQQELDDRVVIIVQMRLRANSGEQKPKTRVLSAGEGKQEDPVI